MSKFIWCDIESSGLDPQKDTILEVAVGVADAATPFALTEVQSWVIGRSKTDLLVLHAVCDAKVMEMHTKSGLWTECEKSTTTLAEVEAELVKLAVQEDADFLHEWVLSYVGDDKGLPEMAVETCRICSVRRDAAPGICERGARQKKTQLAGFSVHFDKGFLTAQMPELRKHLNYRVFDVSSLITYGEMHGMPKLDGGKRPAHRALDDMKQSFIHFCAVNRWLGQRALYPAVKAKPCP